MPVHRVAMSDLQAKLAELHRTGEFVLIAQRVDGKDDEIDLTTSLVNRVETRGDA